MKYFLLVLVFFAWFTIPGRVEAACWPAYSKSWACYANGSGCNVSNNCIYRWSCNVPSGTEEVECCDPGDATCNEAPTTCSGVCSGSTRRLLAVEDGAGCHKVSDGSGGCTCENAGHWGGYCDWNYWEAGNDNGTNCSASKCGTYSNDACTCGCTDTNAGSGCGCHPVDGSNCSSVPGCTWVPPNACINSCSLPTGVTCGQPTCIGGCGLGISCETPVPCCTPSSSWSSWSNTGTCGQFASCKQRESRTCNATCGGLCDGWAANGTVQTQDIKDCTTQPDAPGLVYPAPTGMTSALVPTNLQWSLSSWGCNPSVRNFKVYHCSGASCSPTTPGTITTSNNFSVATTYRTTYNWKIEVDNGVYVTSGPVWSFTTVNPSFFVTIGGNVAANGGAISNTYLPATEYISKKGL